MAVALTLLALALGACRFPTVCTGELRVSIDLAIVDSVSNAPLPGATVVVRGETFRDSVVLSPEQSRYAAMEDRANRGFYDIAVRQSGYREWTRSGVRVRGDECHVTHPAILTARLQSLQ